MSTGLRSITLKRLQEIPNVGPSIAVDLWDLGIHSLKDLNGKSPEEMYERLCTMRGAHIDRCMLYVLRAVVYIASADPVDADKVAWWHWKDPTPPRRRRR